MHKKRPDETEFIILSVYEIIRSVNKRNYNSSINTNLD